MPNDMPKVEDITFPIAMTNKLDGIRCIFKDGEMLSRSLKPIPNKQLQERFQHIKDWTKEYNIILDGEIYDHDMTFQEIVHFVMKKDLGDEELPESLQFHCFDLTDTDFDHSYEYRMNMLYNLDMENGENCIVKVLPTQCKDINQLENEMEIALALGYEGLILRREESKYKFGRYTYKSGDAYKIKPYRTFDAEIIDIVQATKVNPDAEKTVNELGRSVTSKKKGDRVLIDMAACFLVKYEGLDLKVVIALDEEKKKEVRKNKENYIGKMIEYKGMLVGSKDLPRHPIFIRYRDDRG